MRRFTLFLVVLGGALWVWSIPPRTRVLGGAGPPLPVRGTFHVHTQRSDGSGTIESVAAAAATSGLRFVIFTDHGDGVRRPDPPRYVDGVLCIDALEISTSGGHLVALGLPAAPYPLGGEPRDVVQDVKRLGGTAIAAHPGSAKAQLRWNEWTAPIDGLEWLNGDSEWRDERSVSIARALLTYPLRPPESLATLLDRPTAVMAQWDALTRTRRIVALAAGDVHARLGLRDDQDPYDSWLSLHLPSYRQVFRTFSITLPQLRLTGTAAIDGPAVIDEIRRGHVFSTLDGLATPGIVTLTAASGSRRATGGDVLPIEGPIVFDVATNAPAGTTISLLRDGRPVAAADASRLAYTAAPAPGVYRVEVTLPNGPGEPPIPWLVSNPIYVGRSDDVSAVGHAGAAVPEASTNTVEVPEAPVWHVERSAGARATIDASLRHPTGAVTMRYALGGATVDGPYVALASQIGEAFRSSTGLRFVASADAPMRAVVELRGAAGERWRRSVYVDTTRREIAVAFDEMTSLGRRAGRINPVAIRDLLIVVDTVNTAPDARGHLVVEALRSVRSRG